MILVLIKIIKSEIIFTDLCNIFVLFFESCIKYKVYIVYYNYSILCHNMVE